jgi:hypothetical protein
MCSKIIIVGFVAEMEDRGTMEDRHLFNVPAGHSVVVRRDLVHVLTIYSRSMRIHTLFCTRLRCCNSL